MDNATDKEVTKVIFRKFKDGEVIALFPEEPGTNDCNTCDSYMHVGQHGAASVFLVRGTLPAFFDEYLPLLRELENQVGYNLEVVKVFPSTSRSIRTAKINGSY